MPDGSAMRNAGKDGKGDAGEDGRRIECFCGVVKKFVADRS